MHGFRHQLPQLQRQGPPETVPAADPVRAEPRRAPTHESVKRLNMWPQAKAATRWPSQSSSMNLHKANDLSSEEPQVTCDMMPQTDQCEGSVIQES